MFQCYANNLEWHQSSFIGRSPIHSDIIFSYAYILGSLAHFHLFEQINTDPASLKKKQKEEEKKIQLHSQTDLQIMGFFCLGNFIALIGILLVGPTATSGAAVAVAPKADSNGLCYKYVVQAGETCSVIAQAHSITTADIETYNARSWAWAGCGQISQGSFICLSSGEPPMPVALPNAICGPQVPGTARPNSWSDLGSLNPCAANECVS